MNFDYLEPAGVSRCNGDGTHQCLACWHSIVGGKHFYIHCVSRLHCIHLAPFFFFNKNVKQDGFSSGLCNHQWSCVRLEWMKDSEIEEDIREVTIWRIRKIRGMRMATRKKTWRFSKLCVYPRPDRFPKMKLNKYAQTRILHKFNNCQHFTTIINFKKGTLHFFFIISTILRHAIFLTLQLHHESVKSHCVIEYNTWC